MKFVGIAICIFVVAIASTAQSQDGAIMRCGASVGRGYFFKDSLTNPEGPTWEDDAVSTGKIILIKLGEEWDIQFDDTIGGYGYREDGAAVALLGMLNGRITVGAFHANYTDIYTFDVANKEVAWSSHKIGTAIKKVGVYRAPCS